MKFHKWVRGGGMQLLQMLQCSCATAVDHVVPWVHSLKQASAGATETDRQTDRERERKIKLTGVNTMDWGKRDWQQTIQIHFALRRQSICHSPRPAVCSFACQYVVAPNIVTYICSLIIYYVRLHFIATFISVYFSSTFANSSQPPPHLSTGNDDKKDKIIKS